MAAAGRGILRPAAEPEALTGIVGEVAGPEVATANADEPGKTLKGIIRDCFDGSNGRKQVEKWTPAWMRFPTGSCYHS